MRRKDRRIHPLKRSLVQRAIACLTGALAIAAPVHAALKTQDMAELSFEELANIRVTSVSRKAERLADAPASIFVITGEDIRRSGVTTLPEALRLAPNLQVARVDARSYAVTARGFNTTLENKLLVLIDGRVVYSPLFSGVFWDAQDVLMEDIDRIEVISGPGGTLWGANAVNGVINVTTKSSADTQGWMLAAGASRYENHELVRYGGSMANGGHFRIYGKMSEHQDTKNAAGNPVRTGWRRQQGGFRTDWAGAGRNFTLQGDAYRGALRQLGTADISIAGGNLLGRMNSRLEDGSELRVQAYWDYTERDQGTSFIQYLHTVDLEFQHAFKAGKAHDIVWGGGYRRAMDRIVNGAAFAFLPADFNMSWANLFVQDDIALANNLTLTAGVKLEHNNYTGLEFLPNLRLSWKPSERDLIWTSLSRAVRTPSRIDRDFYVPTNPAVVAGVPQYLLGGGPNFVSEVANVVELGYRGQWTPRVSYSATVFYSRYDKLRTLETNPAGPGLVLRNLATGTARGIEMWGSWQAAPTWRLSAGWVAQRIRTEPKAGSVDATASTGLSTNDPSNYWSLRSSHDLAPGHELDFTVRQVGRLKLPAVPAYTTMDVRYAWQIRPGVELSLVGQNLLDQSHAEFGAAATRSEFERALFAKLVWKM